MSPIESEQYLTNNLQGEQLKALKTIIDYIRNKEEYCLKQSLLIDQLTEQIEKGIPQYEKKITKLNKLVKYWEDYSSHLENPDKIEMPIPDCFDYDT